jgi:hypothetical protein
VAAVIVSILAVVMLAMGFFLSRKLFRQWKEKRHVQISSREFDLDFDTTDLEIGSFKPVGRSVSDRSDAPLIKRRDLQRPSSVASFELDSYSKKPNPASSGPFPNPYDMPPPAIILSKPAIPVIKEPSPPSTKVVAPSSLTTAEHQLSTQLANQLTILASRPSFLAKPRTAPRPAAWERPIQEMRAQPLSRLASTRSTRRSRSVDADSPSSVYSQASAAPGGFRPYLDLATSYRSDPIPPVPLLPQEYQSQNFGRVGRRHNALGPFGKVDSPLPLEDSLAFPLPIVDDFPPEPQTPSSLWFKTLWSTTSPLSTSPSPSHSTEDRYQLRSAISEVPSLRSLEVQRSQPHYVVSAASAGQQGTVGYHLPIDWKAGRALIAMPVPQVHDMRGNTPKGPR